MQNSIVANSVSGDDCYDSSTDAAIVNNVVSDVVSILEDGSCGSGAHAIDPELLPLAENGGLTMTHALSIESVARNIVEAASCSIEDQRGELREVSDGFCDVGAYEFVESNGSLDGNNLFYVIPMGSNKAVVVPL